MDRQLGIARVDQANQANRLRDYFFFWVAGLVSACVAAGIAVIAAYIVSQWQELDPSVLIAWFSAEIIQTVGLAYIVAKYLFPPPPKPPTPPSS